MFTPLALLVQDHASCSVLFLLVGKGMTTSQGAALSQAFAQEIRQRSDDRHRNHDEELVLLQEYKAIYCLRSEVYIVIIDRIDRHPHQAHLLLREVRSALTTLTKGLGIATATLLKKYSEVLLLLEGLFHQVSIDAASQEVGDVRASSPSPADRESPVAECSPVLRSEAPLPTELWNATKTLEIPTDFTPQPRRASRVLAALAPQTARERRAETPPPKIESAFSFMDSPLPKSTPSTFGAGENKGLEQCKPGHAKKSSLEEFFGGQSPPQRKAGTPPPSSQAPPPSGSSLIDLDCLFGTAPTSSSSPGQLPAKPSSSNPSQLLSEPTSLGFSPTPSLSNSPVPSSSPLPKSTPPLSPVVEAPKPRSPQPPPPTNASKPIQVLVKERVDANLKYNGTGTGFQTFGEVQVIGRMPLLPPDKLHLPHTVDKVYITLGGSITDDDQVRPNPLHVVKIAKLKYEVTLHISKEAGPRDPLVLLRFKPPETNVSFFPVLGKVEWTPMPSSESSQFVEQLSLSWLVNPHLDIQNLSFLVDPASAQCRPLKQQSKPPGQWDAESGRLLWTVMDGKQTKLPPKLHARFQMGRMADSGNIDLAQHASTRHPIYLKFEGSRQNSTLGNTTVDFYCDEATTQRAVVEGGMLYKFLSGRKYYLSP